MIESPIKRKDLKSDDDNGATAMIIIVFRWSRPRPACSWQGFWTQTAVYIYIYGYRHLTLGRPAVLYYILQQCATLCVIVILCNMLPLLDIKLDIVVVKISQPRSIITFIRGNSFSFQFSNNNIKLPAMIEIWTLRYHNILLGHSRLAAK